MGARQHPLYRRLETDLHPLRYLFVEITQRCNLACRHCGSDCGRELRQGELSTEEWLRFFAYLPQHFDKRKLVLVVTGGEPLCHPELDRLVAGIEAQGLRWGMVSNGWHLSPERLARLLDLGLCSLTISLDGLARWHDWLRGRPGSFQRALRGIAAAVASQRCFIDVVTCVHPGNMEDLPALYGLLQDLGVPAWRLFAIFPKGRAVDQAELRLGAEEMRRLFRFIGEARRTTPPGFVVHFGCEGYLPQEWDVGVRDEPYFCRAGICIASVLSDGAIAACPNICRTLSQGNVRQDDFAQVWAERYQVFRDRSWMQRGDCAGCSEWGRCLGNSMHLWDSEQQRTQCCHYAMLRGHDPLA